MNIEYIKQLPNSPGIYLITNKINNKHYVGQTIRLRKRLLKHLSDSLNNTRVEHILLYKAFRKYGIRYTLIYARLILKLYKLK